MRTAVVVCIGLCFTLVQLGNGQAVPGTQYTIQQLATNNTSACSSSTYAPLGTEYCADGFPGTYYVDFGSEFALGWIDDQYANGIAAPILTSPHDPSPGPPVSGSWSLSLWNVSQGRGKPFTFDTADTAATDMHSLLYGTGQNGSKTKMVMELQSWFCDGVHYDSGLGCGIGSPYYPQDQNPALGNGDIYVNENDGHAYVGYTAWYQPTMDARTVNIWDRGGDVVAWDWYGGPNDCPPSGDTNSFDISQYTNTCLIGQYQSYKFIYADASIQDMVHSIQVTLPQERPGSDMTFFLILDHNAWNNTVCPSAGQTGSQNEPWCAVNKMIADLHYALTGLNENNVSYNHEIPYFTQPNYLTVGGLPVIGFFQDEAVGDDLNQCTANDPCVCDDAGDKCTSQSSCFSDIYQAVTNWLNIQPSPLGANHYYRIFAYETGCPTTTNGHPFSDGCYAWVKPHVFSGGPSQVTTATEGYNDTADPSLDTSIRIPRI
jgi:hypothetical protein